MITSSGRRVYPSNHVDYKGEAPTIEDIGQGLSRVPRFCGHSNTVYTVLCHSYVVSQLMPDEWKIHGLLHDAAESIIGDIPTTCKFESNRIFEDEIRQLIYAEHNIEWPVPDECHKLIKLADMASLIAEANLCNHPSANDIWPIDKIRGVIMDAMVNAAFDVTETVLNDDINIGALLDIDLSRNLFSRWFNDALKLYRDHAALWDD